MAVAEGEELAPLLQRLAASDGERARVLVFLQDFHALCQQPEWATLAVEVLAESARNPAVAEAFAANRRQLQATLAEALQQVARRERRRPVLAPALQAQVLLDAIESDALRRGLGEAGAPMRHRWISACLRCCWAHAHERRRPATHGVDLARYLALAGMVLVNFRLAMAPAEGAGWLAGVFHFLEGKASATFVTLAGLGLVLGAHRQGLVAGQCADLAARTVPAGAGPAQPDAVPGRYPALLRGVFRAGRAVAAGLAAGVAGQHRGDRGLFVLGVAALGLQPGMELADAGIRRSVAMAGRGRNLLFNGFHPLLPWLCFFLLGMLLARLQLSQPRVQRALLVLGLMLIVAGHGVQQLAQERPGRRGWERSRCHRDRPTYSQGRGLQCHCRLPVADAYDRVTGWNRSPRPGA